VIHLVATPPDDQGVPAMPGEAEAITQLTLAAALGFETQVASSTETMVQFQFAEARRNRGRPRVAWDPPPLRHA